MGLREAHEAMKGRLAVVVGGCAGHLGRGVTLGLAREGARIIACDNDRDGLETIVGEVEALGGTIAPIYGDVMDPASLDAFWDEVERLTDRIDILVNVPGGVARMLFENTSRASHEHDIRLAVRHRHRWLRWLARSGFARSRPHPCPPPSARW